MRLLAGLAILLLCQSAYAATSVNLTCARPTTRVDGASFTLAELKGYEFYYQGKTTAKADCAISYPLAYGECVPAGTVFGVSAIDTKGLVSPRGTVTLQTAICRGYPRCRYSYNGYGIKFKWPAGCIP